MVLLTVNSEKELHVAYEFLTARNIKTVKFVEPDLNDQLTAIATEPVDNSRKKIFRSFPLLDGVVVGDQNHDKRK